MAARMVVIYNTQGYSRGRLEDPGQAGSQEAGPVVMQGTPLLTGAAGVPPFNQSALIQALRTDDSDHDAIARRRCGSSVASVLCT
jgi:hypothetical protein